jgi:hypothetical protein
MKTAMNPPHGGFKDWQQWASQRSSRRLHQKSWLVSHAI